MRAQRIGEALLKSGPSPLRSFFAPSISISTSTAVCRPSLLHANPLVLAVIRRSLATKASPFNASNAAAAEPEADNLHQRPRPQPAFANYRTPERANVLQELTTSITGGNKGNTRTGSSGDLWSNNRAGRQNIGQRSSADMVRQASSADSRFQSRITEREGLIVRGLFGDEQSDQGPGDDLTTKLLGDRRYVSQNLPPPPPPVRLDAFVGRSEEVDDTKGVDLARALRKLEYKCIYNNVKRDAASQRFHERPGLKRKRLKSERWRKNFQLGFKAVVTKVIKMRNKGW
ncbi:hypothetical protein MMC19_007643 [Ptychographa xylographoides]|nr:hypothetical protein [Ptychographa xylographoides]